MPGELPTESTHGYVNPDGDRIMHWQSCIKTAALKHPNTVDQPFVNNLKELWCKHMKQCQRDDRVWLTKAWHHLVGLLKEKQHYLHKLVAVGDSTTISTVTGAY